MQRVNNSTRCKARRKQSTLAVRTARRLVPHPPRKGSSPAVKNWDVCSNSIPSPWCDRPLDISRDLARVVSCIVVGSYRMRGKMPYNLC